jgi:ethanolaminephosphotransferase
MYYDVSYVTVWIWVVICSPFYFATWEEYHVGTLNLPVVNGVSDGCTIAGVVFIVIGITGLPAWKVPVVFGISARAWSFFVFAITAFVSCLINARNARLHKTTTLYEMLVTSTAYFGLLATIIVLKLFSPSDVLTTEYVAILAFLGFIFAKECTLIQFGHVTKQIYRMSEVSMVLLATVSLNTVLIWLDLSPFDEIRMLYSLLLLSFVSYSFTIIVGAREMTAALDISVFSINSST